MAIETSDDKSTLYFTPWTQGDKLLQMANLSHPTQYSPDLLHVARKLFWWKAPDDALASPERFVAQVMVWGNWEDVEIARHHFGSDTFLSVLDHPPAGVFDQASWTYWNNVYGRRPTPPLPHRFE